MYSGLDGGLPFVARAALLACVGALALAVRECPYLFPALVPDCSCIPDHPVSFKHSFALPPRPCRCNAYTCSGTEYNSTAYSGFGQGEAKETCCGVGLPLLLPECCRCA